MCSPHVKLRGKQREAARELSPSSCYSARKFWGRKYFMGPSTFFAFFTLLADSFIDDAD